ncbi:murein biosynthesis integral membrane protein MurJ [Gulosibacter sp. ACHW.36C]|uniref:MATE family efflux transporter n=1 Tax=Gulosibacter sediminis TaxID=1729695 RepID=A0ABY4MWL3_9MICO|nr:lipid II flippase MurJ [Gulosibacter sediminis]UQN14807.1 MATE family efflux transporter [Gulosibacter sediminis]
MATSLGRTSLILASGTLVSRVLGFIKAIVLAGTIGLVGSASADAFANANSLPSNVYALISGGLLNAVLVPQIIRATKREDGGRVYVNRLLTLAITGLAGLTLILTIGAPVLAWIYGITLSPEQLGLVIAFAYWCIPQVFFYGLYAVLSEILNARSMFAPFAWAPALNNIIAIGVLALFSVVFGADATGAREISDWTPDMIAMLGGGTTLGVVVQALVLFLFLKKAGFAYRPDFHFRGTGLGRAGKLAGWSFGVLIIVQLTGWIETLGANVAFGTAASLAALQNAWMIFMLPHSIITVSLTTTMFTSLSHKAAAKDTDSVVDDFSRGARAIALFMVFCAVALIIISPAFARIFDSTEDGLEALALVLSAALIGLLAYSLLYYVQRVFYAFEDTKSVFLLYAYTSPLQLVLIGLVAWLVPVEHIVVSLVLVQSFITCIRFVIQSLTLRKRLGSIDGRNVATSIGRFAGLAVPAAVVGLLLVWVMGGYATGGFARTGLMPALITCAVAGVAMATVYFGLALLLRLPELETFAGPLIRRLDGVRGRHSNELHRHARRAAGADRFAQEYGTLVDEVQTDLSGSVASTSQAAPELELVQSSMQNSTRSLPSRRELRQYEAKMRREEYERRIERDDEPLI